FLERDFGCTRFISNPDHEPLFWKSGPKPEHWIERKRRTEHACAEATRTLPDTLYKLVASKQVGKASITGMRVLHRMRSPKGDRLAVWTFEPIQRSAMVEIYPTLFRKVATGSTAKLRSTAELNQALSQLGSRLFTRGHRPRPQSCTDSLSDHETDALISA